MNISELGKLMDRPVAPSATEARETLASAGVQVQEAAAIIGVHPVTLSKWLSGKQRPTGVRATAYAYLIAELQRKCVRR